ncbi:VanZ family protein [Blastococcus sp. KM273128]|uniref:VanZ family protein n=1 Tax=Blastococcus sp. KM273128 TaxID=2570314 RepID=UPI001F4249E9|nr:VanZ family protein [Blastococcus sp. KM273128]MCF6746200.1 VanZ family protein [Blastococcus sp. KM273128]
MPTTRTGLPQAAFAVALLVSAVVLFLPSSGVPTAPPGTDKVVHLLVFAALAGTGRWAGMPRVPLGAALLAYAVGSELVQGLTPIGRSMSAADVVADVVGIVLGLLVWEALTRRER